MKNKQQVNVFFASDKGYLPYLAVAVRSLADNASDTYDYRIRILTDSLTQSDVQPIARALPENVSLDVCDLTERTAHIREELSLRLRDYYSASIYYRLFIQTMFPELDRAVYLDSDIVLTDDVAKLYFTDIGSAIIGAVTDESVVCEPVFRDYVKSHIGLLSERSYINSGVLLMNLAAMREYKIEEKFLHVLCKYNFETVAPDQDYLNFLCKGKIHYLERGWNKHAIEGTEIADSALHVMHYNMFWKPWHYGGVLREELFWHYAERTDFYSQLQAKKAGRSAADAEADRECAARLLDSAKEITARGVSIGDIITRGYFKAVGIV